MEKMNLHGNVCADWKLQDKKWVVMTKGFCIGMKLKLYLLLSIGIRSLIRRRIDEKLSDTGLREV